MRKTGRSASGGLRGRWLVGVVAIGLTGWSGCAGPALSPEAQRVKSETYETVYTVGSHIPKRVAKGEDARSNDGASPVAVLDGEEAREAVRLMRRRN